MAGQLEMRTTNNKKKKTQTMCDEDTYTMKISSDSKRVSVCLCVCVSVCLCVCVSDNSLGVSEKLEVTKQKKRLPTSLPFLSEISAFLACSTFQADC